MRLARYRTGILIMSLTTVHLRDALQRADALFTAHPVERRGDCQFYRAEPWMPPTPLSWWVRCDPALKLGIISCIVAPIITALAMWGAP